MRRFMRTAAIPALFLLALVVAGCDDTSTTDAVGSPPTSPETPTASATAEIPGVPAVVRAVEARDAAALAALVRYTAIPCIAAPQGAGAPPLCSAFDVPPGSTVEALPALLCQGEYLSRSAIPLVLQQQLERGGLVAHGVLGVGAAPYAFPPDFPAVSGWPAPAEAAVFRSTAGTLHLGFYLDGGRIVALRSFGICGPPLPPPDDPAWRVPPPH